MEKDSKFTRDEEGYVAIRTVSAPYSSGTDDKDSMFTRDEDGYVAVRTISGSGGGGGGDQHNLGYYATPEALEEAYPTAEAGDYAIVGSTDSVWVWDDDNSEWLDTGAKETSTYLPFPDGWHTTSSYTTKQFCDGIAADTTAIVGKAYLGEVTISDLPASMANAEIVVEIMSGTTANNKVIVLTCTSGNTAPYRWQYTYWNNGVDVSGWIGFQPELVSGTNIKTINNTSLLGSGNINIESGIPQYSTMPTPESAGAVVQYIGQTTNDYQNNYFYKSEERSIPAEMNITQTVGSGIDSFDFDIDTFINEENPQGSETITLELIQEGSLEFQYEGMTGDFTVQGPSDPFEIPIYGDEPEWEYATAVYYEDGEEQYGISGPTWVLPDSYGDEYPVTPSELEEWGFTITGTVADGDSFDIHFIRTDMEWAYTNLTYPQEPKTINDTAIYGIYWTGYVEVGDTIEVEYVEEGQEYVWKQTDVQNNVQHDSLPEATAANVGQIVQYTGATNTETGLVNGYFYKNIHLRVPTSLAPYTVSDGLGTVSCNLSTFLSEEQPTENENVYFQVFSVPSMVASYTVVQGSFTITGPSNLWDLSGGACGESGYIVYDDGTTVGYGGGDVWIFYLPDDTMLFYDPVSSGLFVTSNTPEYGDKVEYTNAPQGSVTWRKRSKAIEAQSWSEWTDNVDPSDYGITYTGTVTSTNQYIGVEYIQEHDVYLWEESPTQFITQYSYLPDASEPEFQDKIIQYANGNTSVHDDLSGETIESGHFCRSEQIGIMAFGPYTAEVAGVEPNYGTVTISDPEELFHGLEHMMYLDEYAEPSFLFYFGYEGNSDWKVINQQDGTEEYYTTDDILGFGISYTGTEEVGTGFEISLNCRKIGWAYGWYNISVSDGGVTSVNGQTGDVSISMEDLGFPPVDSSAVGKFLTVTDDGDSEQLEWAEVDALPDQSGQNGKFLTTNGTTASWSDVDSLPSQTGNAGKVLTTNGTEASWKDLIITPATEPVLEVANWVEDQQTHVISQTITVQGVTSNNAVLVGPAPLSTDDFVAANVICTGQGNSTLTFTCETMPTNPISVSVIILG